MVLVLQNTTTKCTTERSKKKKQLQTILFFYTEYVRKLLVYIVTYVFLI